MKRNAFLLVVFLTMIFSSTAYAQDDELILTMTRDFGYGGLNGQIEGTFSMRVAGPDDLVEVKFLIDGEIVQIDTEAPFRYQFKTEQYEPGTHALSSTGTLANGETLSSNIVQRTFLTAEEARGATIGFVGPLLIIIGVISVAAILGPLVFGRKKQHIPGKYGMAGGAICPRCTFPYSRSVLSPNMFVGKLERCPHCGKWAVVSRASVDELENAEARLANRDQANRQLPDSGDSDLSKLMDDSRFDN